MNPPTRHRAIRNGRQINRSRILGYSLIVVFGYLSYDGFNVHHGIGEALALFPVLQNLPAKVSMQPD